MNNWPEGYGRRVLDQVDSTNAEAARIAPGSCPDMSRLITQGYVSRRWRHWPDWGGRTSPSAGRRHARSDMALSSLFSSIGDGEPVGGKCPGQGGPGSLGARTRRRHGRKTGR